METSLRKGWTTGACAAAAAKSAWTALVTGAFADPVSIVLPRGETPCFPLSRQERGQDWARAGVVKDAGDDPDVTHRAELVVTVARNPPGSGLVFKAGEGVGSVTLPGLPLAVGEPAITAGPRAQIALNMGSLGEPVDAVVTIAIPGGEALAGKTMNARLGILGGLSILGTTGVVIPYSCAAWIHSIHRGIDVALASGISHLAGCTGKTSERTVQALFGLDERALIDMGGFAGAMLKYLRVHAVPRLTIGGGIGKLAKLAAGEMDLHSTAVGVDVPWLAGLLADLGAPAALVDQAGQAESAGRVLAMSAGWPLADAVARRARETALAVLAGGVAVETVVVDRHGGVIGRAG